MRNIDSYRLVVLGAGCCLLLACQALQPSQGLLEQEAVHANVSSIQLRVLVNDYVTLAAQRIERRADQILAESQDPTIRKNALLWKINVIAACYQAAARNDPLAAYLDVWILNRQLIGLLESPAGYQLFGPWQVATVEECHGLELRLQQIDQLVGVDLALGDMWLGEEFVAKFANDFPVSSLYLEREPLASRYLQHVKQPQRELLQVVANLDANLVELKKLSTMFAAHLPKQARWEAELLLLDSTQLAVVQGPLQDAQRVAFAMADIATSARTLPQMVAHERQALGDLLTQERDATLQEIDRMRRDTLAAVESERQIVLEAMSQERSAVLGSLHDERLAATRDLQSEIRQAMLATDSITKHRTAEIVAASPQVIDHVFLRICQLLGAIAGVGLATLWWFSRNKRRAKLQLRGEENTDQALHVPLPSGSRRAA